MPRVSALTSQLLLLIISVAAFFYLKQPFNVSTQKGLVVTEAGGRVIATSDLPIPQPGPKQVQVRVTVAGINPHDQKVRDVGAFTNGKWPAILAHDVTGVVTVVGPDATKFKIGDRIVSQSGLDGHSQKGLQQWAVLNEDFASKIPEGFSDDEAATLPTNVLAPVIALFDESGLGIPAPWSKEAEAFDYAGTTLLILGGGTNCGRFAVQLGKLAGLGRIITVGGSEEQLKKFGATHVLDRHGGEEAVLQRIRDVVGDDLIYALDTINLPTEQHLGVSALSSSKKGKLARLRFSVGEIDESKIVGEKKAGYEVRNVLGVSSIKPATAKPFWDRVGSYLTNGSLVPLDHQVVDGLDAEQVNQVLDRYRDGKKVVQTQFRVSA